MYVYKIIGNWDNYYIFALNYEGTVNETVYNMCVRVLWRGITKVPSSP